jgi:hypothetical protein
MGGLTVAEKRNSALYELVAECAGALLLGFFGGLAVGTGLWVAELLGWNFDSRLFSSSDYELHLLPESVRTSFLWYSLFALLCGTLGAASLALAHLKRRTTPWKPSWNKDRTATED